MKYTNTPRRRGCFYAMSKEGSKVCKGGGWLEADEEGNHKGQWRRGIHVCTQETHIGVTKEKASVRSRESVNSLQTMGDAESAGSKAQRRQTACAWTRSERALDGERERIHARVVTQSMEGDGMDSLWRAMNVIEGGQGTSAEAKEVREKVVTAVGERWQAGKMQEPLPQGEAGWQAFVRKLLQGRRMGGPPEVEAWAVKSGYRVKVYRETKD